MSAEPIRYYDRYAKAVKTEHIYGEGWLRFAYENPAGRFFVWLLARRAFFSAWYGWKMNQGAHREEGSNIGQLFRLMLGAGDSSQRVLPFIGKYNVNVDEFAKSAFDYKTFNEFFYRALKPEARPIAGGDRVAVLPADGRHLAFANVDAAPGFYVKGQKLRLPELLGDDGVARRFAGGSLLISRLCPVDYHRFHFPAAGTPGESRLINGWLYSVSPLALRRNLRYLVENKREITLLETSGFGTVAVIEVGATNVGTIRQSYVAGRPVAKGEEKGFFAFGGSCVITVFEPGRIRFDADLLEQSSAGVETYARMGDRLGKQRASFLYSMKKILLTLAGLVALAAPAAEMPLAEATIADLQARMAAGQLTSRQLTAAYLERIARLDQAGPLLKSVIELNPDALAIADSLDAERRAGKLRGPLHGIPVLLKDNIDTADRMQTTAGSLALVGQKVPRDAGVVVRLRAAGAVFLGKTNPSEWANYRGNSSSSGWSGRGGQTKNPYALDRNPSGSSSGSGVAASANLCVVAIGTETNGSIVSPASACGIVGVKPTVGLVSRDGIIPISATQDTAGPMARTVRDAALALAAMAGADPRDAATLAIPAGLAAELAALKPGALQGARLGVVRTMPGFHGRMEAIMNRVVQTLRAAGAEVVDPVTIPSLAKLGSSTSMVLSYEFKDGLNRYLAEPGRVTPMKNLADLIAFNDAHAAAEMPFFGQELFTASQARGPLTDPAYVEALAACRRLTRAEGIDAALAADHLDALVYFTKGTAMLTDHINGEGGSGSSSTLAAVAGYPSVTVPASDVFGLPVGVSFTGRAWSDARLLAFAADFESRTNARIEPKFLPTAAVP